MAIERPPGAIGFMVGIQMQHDACDVAPVGILRIRVEQTQIYDDVFVGVNGQYGIGGRGIGDIGIKRRLLHGLSRNSCSSVNLTWLLGILMTAKPSPHSHIDQQRTSSTQEVEGLVDAYVQITMCRVDDKVVTVPIIVCAQNDCMPVGQGQSDDVT